MEIELDATAGDRVIHAGKDTSQIIFLDVLSSVKPDIIGDAKKLPFRSGVFSKIYCDPPHLIRNDKKYWSKWYIRFGNFKNRREWIIFLANIDIEFKRVLREDGLLWFKITDGRDRRVTKLADLQIMRNFEEVCREKQQKRAGWSTNTPWHILYKIRSSESKVNKNG